MRFKTRVALDILGSRVEKGTSIELPLGQALQYDANDLRLDYAQAEGAFRYDTLLLTKVTFGWRIPSILMLTETTGLLFVAQLPVGAVSDYPGAIVTVYDVTWNPKTPSLTVGSARTVINNGTSKTGPGAANMSPGLIRTGPHAGRVLLFYSTNVDNPPASGQAGNQVTYLVYSDDKGQTWSAPRRMTEFETHGSPDTVCPASGPKVIQLRYGAHAGRLLVSLYTGTISRSFCAWSDDGGDTWTPSSQTLSGTGTFTTNETAIAEHTDGTVYASCRTASTKYRALRKSTDGGQTFTTVYTSSIAGFPQWLPDPACEGDMVQAAYKSRTALPGFIHVNDNTYVDQNGTRCDLTISLSDGDWSSNSGAPDAVYHINDDRTEYTGYSSIDMIDDDKIVLVFEKPPGTSNTGASVGACVLNRAEVCGLA